MDYNYYDVERAFCEALCDAGVEPADGDSGLRLDGEKHRYRVKGDRGNEKSGEYCVYMDERPAGYFKSYKVSHGVPFSTWSYQSDTFCEMSSEEKAAYVERRRLEKIARDQDKAREAAEASRKARLLWSISTPASPAHGYCLKKKLNDAHGARLSRQPGEVLVIPYRSIGGEVVTVQTISADGTKRFTAGAPKAGAFCVLPPAASEMAIEEEEPARLSFSGRVWVAEGWATACSVAEAVGEQAVAAADAGNLFPVVRQLRDRWPGVEFVVAADNDGYKRDGNTGCGAAFRVYDELGVPFCAPDFPAGVKASDWNDFACLYGLAKTRALLLRKLEEFKKTPDFEVRHSVPQWVQVAENSGRPLGTIGNLEALLAYCRIRVGYDEVKKDEILDVPGQRFCGDNAVNAALGYVYSACCEWGFPQKNVDLFLTNIASRNVSNPVKDWILSEPWDGQSRVQSVCQALVVEKGFPEWFRDVLVKKWLLSAVAAVMCDPAKESFNCEGSLILHGPQGIGKTTFFRNLCGGHDEWFGNGLSIDPSQKDSVMPAIRCWIVEMGEVDSTFRKADLSRLKAYLSNNTDVIRAPYGKRSCDYQRRTVFCGTVNQASFLMDKTGNRRFWCVSVRAIARLDPADMQQMWAEVYESMYPKHVENPRSDEFGWWLSPREKAQLDVQNWDFEIPDPVEDMIMTRLNWDMYQEKWTYKTCVQILSELGVINAAAQTGLCMKAGEAIRKRTGQNAVRRHGGRMYLVPDVIPKHDAIIQSVLDDED